MFSIVSVRLGGDKPVQTQSCILDWPPKTILPPLPSLCGCVIIMYAFCVLHFQIVQCLVYAPIYFPFGLCPFARCFPLYMLPLLHNPLFILSCRLPGAKTFTNAFIAYTELKGLIANRRGASIHTFLSASRCQDFYQRIHCIHRT